MVHVLTQNNYTLLLLEKDHDYVVNTHTEYSIYRMYSDRQAWANSVNQDETPQKAASNHGLH